MSSSSSPHPSSSRPSLTKQTIRPAFSQSFFPSSSRPLSSSTRVHPFTSALQASPYPSTSSTGSIDQSAISSMLSGFNPTSTQGAFHSGGSTSHRIAVITALVVIGILLFVLLMLFTCCRRHRRNLKLEAQARDRCVATLRHSDSTNKRERKPFPYSSDEQMLEYAENGLAKQQSDGSNHPYLVGVPPTRSTENRDPYLESPLDHQENPQKSLPPTPDENPTTANRSLIITPSRAYLPFPDRRRLSRPLSPPSIHPVILPAEEDGDLDRQLPTPMSILYPETTAVRNRDSDHDTITEKLVSRGCPVAASNSEPDRGYPDSLWTDSYCDGHRQSYPPPIPPKSPLRGALSMRTMLNDVQARESKMES